MLESSYIVAGLATLLVVTGFIARLVINKIASASAVDHYYWMIAAEAYRQQSKLPIRITGKYLMEDETQAYPPLFGFLLGRMPGKYIDSLTKVIEFIEVLVLVILLFILGAGWQTALLALAIYISAPVLVVYNAQLTPRILGDFFLLCAIVSQVAAAYIISQDILSITFWALSAVFIALLIATHKMSLQLYVVLLPAWMYVLDKWEVLIATIAGFILYTMLVGYKFVLYQLKAHLDIVKFWNLNWRNLGAHQFHHSPIYGNPDADRSSCFHVPGLPGIIKHLRLVVSYLPFAIVLPLASISSGVWPPIWVLIWLSAIYVMALGTLYIPALKCLGGGHLYVFNAVIPASIYVTFLPITQTVMMLYIIAIALTVFSLVMAYQTVCCRSTARDDDFIQILEELNQLQPSRIAVLPTQSAEVVAAKTKHAVLWGAHGYGFKQLDGFFPVASQPIKSYTDKYSVNWILWDKCYWPEGEELLGKELQLKKDSMRIIGCWCLAEIR